MHVSFKRASQPNLISTPAAVSIVLEYNQSTDLSLFESITGAAQLRPAEKTSAANPLN